LIALLPLIDNIRIYEDVDSTNVCVQFHTKFGWVRFGQLGHGYQTMIGWVVDLASRMFKAYPDSKDPLSEAAVVLVDEIDLHMHPEWQRKIMGYLSERFPKVQFIATAHSPLIVQGADENTNIAVLRREGDHVVIDNDPENVRNWRVDQILASDLFSVEGRRSSDTDDLLAKRRKILSKPKLTKKDRAKVEEMEEQVGYLPGEETVEDREAWEIVRRAADRLKKQNTAAE
jgi:predicted ATP-binding protein involved in virulence